MPSRSHIPSTCALAACLCLVPVCGAADATTSEAGVEAGAEAVSETDSSWRPVLDEAIGELGGSVPAESRSDPVAGGSGAIVPVTGWYSLVDRASRVARAWTKRVEIGARVLRGNTDEDFVRLAGAILRERENALHRIDWGGRFGQVNGLRNTNRWFLESTIDRVQPAGWLYYINSKHEYNEFQGIDYRGSGSIGVGYKFVDEKDRHLLMRLGPGLTLEVYSDSDGHRVTEDFSAELEIDWPLFERTRLESKTTMRPSIIALDVFRFRTDTSVLVPLDDEARWSLKLGYLLDYNSSLESANNRLPMDLTTSVSIVYMRP
jgi:putative salt-induced outer membrane protein YdiY